MHGNIHGNIHGILVLDKPAGMTSASAVDRVRRALGISRAGHGGTLDPIATGVLPIAFGEATKTVAYAMDGTKTYRFRLRWGEQTTTDDLEGSVIATSDHRPTEDEIEVALEAFQGPISQVPPQFSAKKVQGVRAYELARKGEVANLTPKKVTVYEFEITKVEGSTAQFRVRSSAGTYIRSLAHDLGIAAGVPAHLKELRRTVIGNFKVEDAIHFDRIAEASIEEIIARPQFQSLSEIDLPLEKLRIDWTQQGKMMRGQAVIMTPAVPVKQGDLLALGNPSDQLVVIGEVANVLREGGPVEVKPKVVLAG